MPSYDQDVTRVIQLEMTSEVSEQALEVAGAQQLWFAIGYLSQWSLSYAHCTLRVFMSDGVPEMVATYSDDPSATGRPLYVIGAVWHGSHFGFHS